MVDGEKKISPNDDLLQENNFEMAILDEGFDAVVEVTERLLDTQLASNTKNMELSRLDLPQGAGIQ